VPIGRIGGSDKLRFVSYVCILLDVALICDGAEKEEMELRCFLVRFSDACSQSVCEHCGANNYANDVFKKIKDLIG